MTKLSLIPAAAALIDYDGRSVADVLAQLEYAGLAITSMTAVPAQIEAGGSADVTVSWTLLGTPTGQTLEGVTVAVGTLSKLFPGVSAAITYDLYVEDTGAPGGTASDTRQASVACLDKGHAGTINKTDGATLTSAEVNAMAQSWFETGSLSRTRNFTTAADGAIWVSIPAAFADPATFKVNNNVIVPVKTTRSHTTATGQVVAYDDFLLSDVISAGTAIVLEIIG
ncbi:hypothetical protein SAMN05518801_10740 [Novosphingobium sp. CF614]|uniref:hypothetical protein n=1 Tax=Novosphingobium sp. CF614 TaxID=1884364 RepID=UPI0008E936A8|nr:hypothetical protein [Novosphingobium sp. CF614]SFG08503.1 hypothetical protein SAMN05518801_10740 [Novosphingobium sp. CF614]